MNPVVWTVDMKNSPGEIKQGRHDKPDATFTMLDENIVLMSEGKLNGQQAFMQGKMKIKGNMAAAMKFTPDLLKPPTGGDSVAPSQSSSPSPSISHGADLKSTKLFLSMGDLLKANGKAVCAKVNAIFNFEVLKNSDDKNPTIWTIDMKNSPGEIKAGKHDKPDATFTMLDENILLMSEGKLNG